MSDEKFHTFKDLPILECKDLTVEYSSKPAFKALDFQIPENKVIALIGPSGCGKSTLLRCFNRMNDTIKAANVIGDVLFKGNNIYQKNLDPTDIRFKIGMVFQKPNPFPKSIFDNVAVGPKINNFKVDLKELVEQSLQRADLWDEVKDRLNMLGTKLSGGQQQRLTIARALSHQPEILCLDEFSIAIDPVTTMKIEDVLLELKQELTIVLVTNLVQQARRLADHTAFFNKSELIEYGSTEKIFSEPEEQITLDYVMGDFG